MNPLPAAESSGADARSAGSSTPLRGAATPLRERLVELALWGCGGIPLLTTLGIAMMLTVETAGFFREVGFSEFFLHVQWAPHAAEPQFGIWPLVTGTLVVSAIAVALAAPLGLLAAIYLVELAPVRVRRLLEPPLELLAVVPTVVYACFALVFATPLLQRAMPSLGDFNALVPGIVMGVMLTPIGASLSKEALRAVPAGVREAAHGLGATRLSTLFRVVLPGAAAGVTASVALLASRAVGETMIVAIAAGHQAQLTLDPRAPVETLTAYILHDSLGDMPAGAVSDHALFAVGGLLLALTLTTNAIGLRLVKRLGACA